MERMGGWGGWYYYSNSIVLEISVEPYFLLEYNKHAHTHLCTSEQLFTAKVIIRSDRFIITGGQSSTFSYSG